MTLNLDALARKYGTDKSSAVHGYTNLYERLTSATRLSTGLVIEIGVLNGASMRMWEEWFPNATIIGIDNKSESANIPEETSRMKLVFGDQNDPKIWEIIPHDLDLVVDDGSHVPEHMMGTFINNFHKLRSGGLWIIEDIHCVFAERFNPLGSMQIFEWIGTLSKKLQMEGRATGNFRKAALDEREALTRQIFGISVYKSVIVFERA